MYSLLMIFFSCSSSISETEYQELMDQNTELSVALEKQEQIAQRAAEDALHAQAKALEAVERAQEAQMHAENQIEIHTRKVRELETQLANCK